MTGTIYFVEAIGADRIKIGWTGGRVEKRLSELQVCAPFPLRVIGTFPGSQRDERRLHRQLTRHRVIGEWFRFSSLAEEGRALMSAMGVS